MSFIRSLRAKTLLFALVPMTLMLAIAAALASYAYERVTQDLITQRDAELARVSAARLSENLSHYSQLLQDIAAEDDLRSMEPARLSSALEKAQSQLYVFDAGVVVYDSEGAALSSRQGTGFPIPSEFDQVREALRPAFSNVFKDAISGEDVILVGVPIVGDGGEFKGVLAGMCTLKYSMLGATYAGVLEFKAGRSGHAYLVDGNGRVIYHRYSSQVGRSLAEAVPVMKVTGGETGAVLTDDAAGETGVSGFAPVPGTDWGLITEERWDVVTGPVRGYVALLLGILVVGSVASGALAFTSISRILKPIQDLAKGAQRIAGGDFDHPVMARTGDEIEALARQFNAMASALKESFAELEQRLAEHRRAEEALRESEERFRQFFENEPEYCYMVSPEGIILDVNSAALEALGYNKKGLVGKPLKTIYAPESLPKMEQLLAKWKKNAHLRDEEMVVITKNEDRRTVLLSAGVVRDKNGEILHSVSVQRDITERKRLEHEIEERRLYLESVLACAPDAIVTLDAQHNILEWNPGAARLFEYTLDEVVGRNIDELITGPDHEVFEEATGFTRRVLAGEDIPPTEAVRYRKDGSPVDVIVSASPISIEDGVTGVVFVYTDITEQKQTEKALQQQERLAAVGQLASGIAHDFNNLLTAIMLYAQVPLRKRDLPPDLKRAFETILDESRQAAKLVGQILDFSRRSPIKTHPVDLKPFIKEAVRVLERTIPESISFLLEVGPGDYVVKADPTRIQQVLMNLVVNARDAMPEGGKLRIELSRVDVIPGAVGAPSRVGGAEGGWVCLAVSDTGMGMTEEVRSHLFEPFFTTKEPGKGTGLGLAQVYGIVRQHEGYIGVETEVGKGTTFRVYLPAHQAEEKIVREEVSTTPRGKGETILLVEDNERLREGGQELLESLGYRVLTAANGREALEVYAVAGGADLVITDLVMPEMGGRELIQGLRKMDPGLKALAITGYVLADDLEELKEEDILDVVYKPLDVSLLAEVVRRALDTE